MTNKTKLSVAALFSALVLGGSFAGSTVFAEDTPTDTTTETATDPAAEVKKGPDTTPGVDTNQVSEEGHAYVTYTKNDPNGTKDPGDPDNPDVPPTNPGDKTNETGELTLDAIPSELNFGTQESTGAGQVAKLLSSVNPDDKRALSNGKANDGQKTSEYAKANEDGSTTQVIFTQVTNVATTNPTWTLSANMSDFSSDTGATLPGAFITFGNGADVLDSLKTPADPANKKAANYEWKDQGDLNQNATMYAGSDDPTTGAAQATFVTDSSKTGTFQQQWNVSDVSLTTPQAPAKGQYTATVNWILSATPATK